MEMCNENCDTCIEDKSCCNGVYRPLFSPCIWCENAHGCDHRYHSDECREYLFID